MSTLLVLNSGSSSIKFELFDTDGIASIAAGCVERLGEASGRQTCLIRQENGKTAEQSSNQKLADHREGFDYIAKTLFETGLIEGSGSLRGIGHRVVHGGEKFREPTLLDDAVLEVIRKQTVLAPLHNPANLLGVEVALQTYPGVPQVAVFDTAFHQTIPPHAYLYAIPYEHYERHGIRRYGFHGTSHQYVARAAAEYLERPLDKLRLITIHLGNGASMAAIDRGKCVDTSMGLTPLEGLMMGTRSGDIDPAVVPFLADNEGMSLGEVDAMLNKQSGLKGICGENDMREILHRVEQGDRRAALAVEMYAYRIKKYLGAYLAVLGGADAIVFTAGIGENSPAVREMACAGLEGIGIALDVEKNSTAASDTREIQSTSSDVRILVVPTDEELEIARQTLACIEAGGSPGN
ncbi:MAG: acetate kinase [Planctomycetota bacterium]